MRSKTETAGREAEGGKAVVRGGGEGHGKRIKTTCQEKSKT